MVVPHLYRGAAKKNKKKARCAQQPAAVEETLEAAATELVSRPAVFSVAGAAEEIRQDGGGC